MARDRTIYVCQSCGARSPRWLGRCSDCQGWNTLVEEREEAPPTAGKRRPAGHHAEPAPIGAVADAGEARTPCGIGELDRVLGGGVVAGSVVLVGGDPGIGKSTLVLQALTALSRRSTTLYVSGEESPAQIKMRAVRLGSTTGPSADNLLVLAETSVDRILEQASRISPSALVIDSVQTMFLEDLGSAAGSVSQVRECSAALVAWAKRHGVPTFLIGHVTKEGALAGPRVLEHMVDTVLYFEGDRGHSFRILRAVKNRFGSTNEIGVFEMAQSGLQPVANPSALFLAERPEDVPGSVVVATVEGTRPILVEVQALVSATSFGTPRRTTLGVDPTRVALLIAILEKKMGLHLLGHDVFVNVAGGVRLDEPAADLGVAAAIASSFLDRPVDAQTLLIGELGLAGEVRAVGNVELRVREGAKLGFTRSVVPEAVRKQVPPLDGVTVRAVSSLQEAWDVLF
jgi:DNA repair protein RadA/Sms